MATKFCSQGPAPGILQCWRQSNTTNRSNAGTQIVISVALATLAAVAAYYCLVHGLRGLGDGLPSINTLKCSLLIYTGIALGIAAAGNIGCAIFGRPCNLNKQVGGTLLSPLFVSPPAMYIIFCSLLQQKTGTIINCPFPC